ncbi:MAG: GNAT family N-acetyltransferase [Alphaproteobacteria bacterium]|nr:GNAT family N-acetyltransferase [Alphaproteobacteria bacterium]
MNFQTDQFDVRIAKDNTEIEVAQRLRYQVFFEEHGTIPSPVVARTRLDTDAYDYCCDHMVVIDRRFRRIRDAGGSYFPSTLQCR